MKIKLITALSTAVAGLFRWLGTRGTNLPFKMLKVENKRLKKAVEAGEKYIQTNNEDLSPARRTKLLKHYEKRFFHYN